MLPQARAALQRVWLDQVYAEMQRRAEGPGEEAGEEIVSILETMADRFTVSARPGDRESAEQLASLVRAKDYVAAEVVRVEVDLSPAEVTALLLSTGDVTAARRWLERYIARERRGG